MWQKLFLTPDYIETIIPESLKMSEINNKCLVSPKKTCKSALCLKREAGDHCLSSRMVFVSEPIVWLASQKVQLFRVICQLPLIRFRG